MTSPYYQFQLGEFDESQHKRDSGGKFADKEGVKKEKPAKAKQTASPEFRKWFGDSKVVDDDGEPLRVFHGTTSSFTSFDPNKLGRSTGHRTASMGFFFSSANNSKTFAENVFGEAKPGANLIPVYLSMRNPKEIEAREFSRRFIENGSSSSVKAFVDSAKKSGHDGIIIKGDAEYAKLDHKGEYIDDTHIAFSPTQIKSAIANKGTFDPSNPSITMAEGDPGDTVDATANALTNPAAAAARREVAHTSSAITAALKKKSLSAVAVPSIMPDIERELQALVASLNETLADSLLAAEITGAGEVAASVPASLMPTIAGPGFPSTPPTVPPVAPTTTSLFGRAPRIIFPAVDDAVARLSDSPVFAGTDFRETARAVQNGSFAITTELGDEMVGQIRDVLQENVDTGADMGKFIFDVENLFDEGGGLSDSRLDMVFRNNVGQSLMDGQERALQQPLVADAFPYRRKFVTKDTRVRPEHLLIAESGLNGTAIYRANDPVWDTFRGRWDFNCRCSDGPVTVEMAARAGVEEAKEWLERAQRQADQFGGVAAMYLGETAPAVPEHVEWPTINGVRVMPPAEFQRQGPVQFHEWQLAEQAAGCWCFAEFKEAEHPRESSGKFTSGPGEGKEPTGHTKSVVFSGDKVIKEATKQEVAILSKLQGIEGIVSANIEGETVTMPKFPFVFSVDDIEPKRRKSVGTMLGKPGVIARIVNGMSGLSLLGKSYNDQLQVGMGKDRLAHVLDFGNSESENVPEAQTENAIAVANFLKVFGQERHGRGISSAANVLEFVRNDDAREFAEFEDDAIAAEQIVRRLDGPANHAYYSFNQRAVPFPSGSHDGATIVVTSEPLTPEQMEEWELNLAITSEPKRQDGLHADVKVQKPYEITQFDELLSWLNEAEATQ